ncbi:MAG: methyltransferase domain-containing protein [Dehalococcoidia bacterium]
MSKIAEPQPTYSTDAIVERIFNAALETMDLLAVYVGDRLGLYTALAAAPPMTPAELAGATGTAERYAREWLEQQATTGFLAAHESSEGRRFSLPAEHAEALVRPTSLAHMAPLARFLVAAANRAPDLLDAFRTGEGLPWDAYGADAREAQSDFNRPLFHHQFVGEHLSAVPGLAASLARSGARVAEIGFGGGWAAISIAQAFPDIRVDGFDLDAASVDLARANAEAEGVSHRVTFHHRDAGDGALDGQYDLVFAFECVHDMSNPVASLATMRRLAAPGGTVLVVDERVGERFGENIGDPIERLMYGFSLFVCLPNGLADSPSAATGTVMRPSTLERYAVEAGFRGIDILPVEHDMFRYYRMLT